MTIKTECVIKHLKHDYKEIGKGLGILLAGIACIVILAYVSLYLAPYWTGEGVLNTCAAILAFAFIVPMMIWGDIHTNAYKDSKTGVETDGGYCAMLFIATMFGVFIYVLYAMGVVFRTYPEFPFYSMIAYFAAIFIGVPFSCAVARCRE